MEQILLVCSLPKEIVAAIMMLYINTEVMVRSPDGDTDFSDIVACVLQGDILAPYFFYILPPLCTSDIHRSNKRKWSHIE